MTPDRLPWLDCQNERPYEPVDPDHEGVTLWVDEHGDTHGEPRRWHAARAFALAVLEAGVLWGAVIIGVVAAWGLFWAAWTELP